MLLEKETIQFITLAVYKINHLIVSNERILYVTDVLTYNLLFAYCSCVYCFAKMGDIYENVVYMKYAGL